MIFDVPRTIEILSEIMTLEPGDVIATGTPPGVGHARTPPVWMRDGDICEIEIEGIGILRNPIRDEAPAIGRGGSMNASQPEALLLEVRNVSKRFGGAGAEAPISASTQAISTLCSAPTAPASRR